MLMHTTRCEKHFPRRNPFQFFFGRACEKIESALAARSCACSVRWIFQVCHLWKKRKSILRVVKAKAQLYFGSGIHIFCVRHIWDASCVKSILGKEHENLFKHP